jgi:hypothetical protein
MSDSLSEIVPKNTSWIFHDSSIHRDISRLILDDRPRLPLLNRIQIAEFRELREPPIGFF